ncbi:MAG: LysE family translocator [Phormidesmis sp.]
MSSETLAALCLFAIATSITPGPNNIMLLASGVNFGLRRTLPHTLGISIGLCVLLLAVGLGLGFLFTAFPSLQVALKIVGSLYMLYLALRIATSRSIKQSIKKADAQSGPDHAESTRSRPMTFLEAALFLWVNPKAWVMAISGMSLYTNPARPYGSMLAVALIFSLLNWPSCSVWAVSGRTLRGFLFQPVRLKWFNIGMGVLLAASVVLLLK